MPDSPAPAERQTIDLTRESDVAYWCRIFDVSIDQLREAVRKAGHEPGEVQRHLGARPAGQPLVR